MATTVTIPRSYMGHTLQEVSVKRVLRAANPEIHFDMGVSLGIWHPYQQSRQNVFYRGRSVVAMDRGTLPEGPIWSLRRELVEIPWWEVRPHELAMYGSAGIVAICLKCNHRWDLPVRPMGYVLCPALCENMGQVPDETLFIFRDKPTERAWVWREIKDRVLLVGWRHTFGKLIAKVIPGLTKELLETSFGINLDPHEIADEAIPENLEERLLDRSMEVIG